MCIMLCIFSSCTDDLTQGSSDDFESLDIPEISTPLVKEVVYRDIGVKFRGTLFDFYLNPSSYDLTASEEALSSVNEHNTFLLLENYADKGLISSKEIAAFTSLIDMLDGEELYATDKITNTHNFFESFAAENSISLTGTPVTYAALRVVQHSTFSTDTYNATLGGKTAHQKGENDGQLCSPPWFCGSGANAALTVGNAVALNEFRTTVEWSASAEVAAAAAISLAITSGFSWFCRQIANCDDCAAPVGVTILRDGPGNCNFAGIRPVGTFEWAERAEFFIDDNQNGVFIGPLVSTSIEEFPEFILTDNQLVSLEIDLNSQFDVFVDITCDGGGAANWPVGQQNPVRIDPSPDRVPVGTISRPPLTNGYYYRPGTQICFQLNSFNAMGNTFVGWRAPGGSPSTGSANTQFCTTFNQSTALPRGVQAVFQSPCTNQEFLLGTSFLICPPSQCQ